MEWEELETTRRRPIRSPPSPRSRPRPEYHAGHPQCCSPSRPLGPPRRPPASAPWCVLLLFAALLGQPTDGCSLPPLPGLSVPAMRSPTLSTTPGHPPEPPRPRDGRPSPLPLPLLPSSPSLPLALAPAPAHPARAPACPLPTHFRQQSASPTRPPSRTTTSTPATPTSLPTPRTSLSSSAASTTASRTTWSPPRPVRPSFPLSSRTAPRDGRAGGARA